MSLGKDLYIYYEHKLYCAGSQHWGHILGDIPHRDLHCIRVYRNICHYHIVHSIHMEMDYTDLILPVHLLEEELTLLSQSYKK